MKWIFAVLFIFSFNSRAADSAVVGDCCVCQTGIGPKSSLPFFKLGCSVWLAKQENCALKETQDFGDYDLSQIPKSCDGRDLKMAYVGHWGTSDGSAYYVKKIAHDLVEKRKMSVDFENTACRGLDEGNHLADELQNLSLPLGKHITYRGYQVKSVGLWEPFIPGKPNFWSEYDSRTGKIEYPKCEEYEFQGCMRHFANQIGKTAYCRSENNELKELTCCEAEILRKRKYGKNENEVDEVISTAKWLAAELCGTRLPKK
jgi:hypothetical protein